MKLPRPSVRHHFIVHVEEYFQVSGGVPATFYVHPWELHPQQSRNAAPFQTRLLSSFPFQPIATTLGLHYSQFIAHASPAAAGE